MFVKPKAELDYSLKAGNARFLWLDVWRGLAAFSILTYHIPGLSSYFFDANFLYVDFFFILSGFVLKPKFFSVENKFESKISFLEDRIRRLFPIAFIGLMIVFFTEIFSWIHEVTTKHFGESRAFGELRPWWSIIFALLFMQIFIPSANHWIGALWSLSVEWWTNVLGVLISGKQQILATFINLILGIALIFPFLISQKSNYWVGLSWNVGRGLVGLNLGILVRVFTEKKRKEVNAHFFYLILFSLPVGIWAVWHYLKWSGWPIAIILFSMAIAMTSYFANPDSNSGIASIARYLGKVSYGIYVYHQVVQAILGVLESLLHFGLFGLSELLTVMSCTILLTAVSNSFLEPFVVSKLDNWILRRKSQKEENLFGRATDF